MKFLEYHGLYGRKYHLEFDGGEDKFGCLEFGMLCVEEQQDVIPYIEAWNWIDEECPDESCDMLEEISIPVGKIEQINQLYKKDKRYDDIT